MAEADFAQAMTPEEPRLVDIAVDADDTALAGVLPQGDVAFISQHRLLVEIHGYHQLIVIELANEVPVVEIAEGVDERFLMIGHFDHAEECKQRVAELVYLQTA